MPELPEVETVRRGLDALVPGQRIRDVEHDWTKSFPNAQVDVQRYLIGAQVLRIRRRAKVLIVDLDTKYSLIIHLKMTGQLVFIGKTEAAQTENVRFGAGHPTDSLVGSLPDNSTRVSLTFQSGDKLYFNDQRKFGWVKLMPTIEIPNIDFFRKVGPEPLEASFTEAVFRAQLARRKNSTIKAALLDQTVVAGVGNIYADESLWAARIHPATRVNEVSDDALDTLFSKLRLVLQKAIDAGGSTDKNYVNAEGKRGGYLSFAEVFRREGKACSRCGSIIEKIRVAGRGTHICSECQKVRK